MYDFPIPGLGKAVLYGIHDVSDNVGWVNLGISYDTAAFAVESIRRLSSTLLKIYGIHPVLNVKDGFSSENLVNPVQGEAEPAEISERAPTFGGHGPI